ncbi:MAG TPA: hypothetical protein VHA34_19895, partial [Actinomycetes bacterium]|nr:hypothetical protein [Actinomycetes bacterium]
AEEPRPPDPSPGADAAQDEKAKWERAVRNSSTGETPKLDWMVDEGPPPPPPSPPVPDDRVAALEARLAALEGVPGTVDVLGKAVRHELERCAGVLFGHDRALGALAARLDALEAPPAVATTGERSNLTEESVLRVLDQFERLEQRVNAAEARVEPLEPLPTLVQALRRAVRASDELIAGERSAREQAFEALSTEVAADAQAREDALRRLVAQDLDRVSGIATAQAKGLADLSERLAAAESSLAPLTSVPDDLAALSRLLRRELDAVVSDNQARDQMLRRALQNEIDQLQATSEAREALAKELSVRLDALELRANEAAEASQQAAETAGRRLEGLEGRIAGVDRLSGELATLRDTVVKDLEQLRAGGQAHDQVAGELTRRLSALDAKMARIDPLPGEVQSLRTAMLQDAERTVASLRAIEERLAQLAWVPGEFQEARKRIMALSTGVQAGQDKIRQLEAAVASASERLDAVRARLATSVTPPGPPG